MLIDVGDNTYGWGPEVANLPTDPSGAGPRVIDQHEAKALNDEVEANGWEPAGDTGEEVFLVAPKAWKRPLSLAWDAEVKITVRERPEVPLSTDPMLRVAEIAVAFDVPEDLVLQGPQTTPSSTAGDREESFTFFLAEAEPDGREPYVSTFELKASMTLEEARTRFLTARDAIREMQKSEDAIPPDAGEAVEEALDRTYGPEDEPKDEGEDAASDTPEDA